MSAPEDRPAAGSPLNSAQVAALVGGRAEGPEVTIRGVLDLEGAGPADAAFFGRGPGRHAARASARDLERLAASKAGLVLTTEEADCGARACVRVKNPPLAAAMLTRHFHPGPRRYAAGVHPSAVVEEGAVLGAEVSVGPGCVVRAGARIGDRCVLAARVYVGEDAEIGADCYFHPGVTVYQGVRVGRGCQLHANVVVGADGFGYVWDGSRHYKVPQIGTVEIGDEVEIGANSCIDRGTFRATRVGAGTVIDNLVQVGHNCEIGRSAVLCGLVGLGGSTVVGDGAVFGGAAGSAGHVKVGAGATVVGFAAVVTEIGEKETVAGVPAWPVRNEMRAVHQLRRLVTDRGRKKEGGAGE